MNSSGGQWDPVLLNKGFYRMCFCMNLIADQSVRALLLNVKSCGGTFFRRLGLELAR